MRVLNSRIVVCNIASHSPSHPVLTGIPWVQEEATEEDVTQRCMEVKVGLGILFRIRGLSKQHATLDSAVDVIVIPGKRSAPRCVRCCEWPPRRATNDKSRSNFSISHSTPGPDS